MVHSILGTLASLFSIHSVLAIVIALAAYIFFSGVVHAVLQHINDSKTWKPINQTWFSILWIATVPLVVGFIGAFCLFGFIPYILHETPRKAFYRLIDYMKKSPALASGQERQS